MKHATQAMLTMMITAASLAVVGCGSMPASKKGASESRSVAAQTTATDSGTSSVTEATPAVAFNTSIAGVLAIAATSNAASLSLTATPNPCVATSSRLVYTVNKDGTTSPFPCPEGYGLISYVYTKSGILANYGKPRAQPHGDAVPNITFFLPSNGNAVQQMPLPVPASPFNVIAPSYLSGENSVGDLIFLVPDSSAKTGGEFYTYTPSAGKFTDHQTLPLQTMALATTTAVENGVSIDTMQIGNRLYHTVLKKYFPISSINRLAWASLTSTKILEKDQIFDMETGVSTPWTCPIRSCPTTPGIPMASGGYIYLQGTDLVTVDINAKFSTYADLSKTAPDAVSIRKTKNGILIEGSKGNMYQIASSGLSLTDAAPTVTSLPSSGYHITKFSASPTSNNLYFTAEDFQGNPFVGSQDLTTLKNTVYPGDASKASEIQAVQ